MVRTFAASQARARWSTQMEASPAPTCPPTHLSIYPGVTSVATSPLLPCSSSWQHPPRHLTGLLSGLIPFSSHKHTDAVRDMAAKTPQTADFRGPQPPLRIAGPQPAPAHPVHSQCGAPRTRRTTPDGSQPVPAQESCPPGARPRPTSQRVPAAPEDEDV